MNSDLSQNVVEARCTICEGKGQIEIPAWRADVGGWGYEFAPCPVCQGRGYLSKEKALLALYRLTNPPAANEAIRALDAASPKWRIERLGEGDPEDDQYRCDLDGYIAYGVNAIEAINKALRQKERFEQE